MNVIGSADIVPGSRKNVRERTWKCLDKGQATDAGARDGPGPVLASVYRRVKLRMQRRVNVGHLCL